MGWNELTKRIFFLPLLKYEKMRVYNEADANRFKTYERKDTFTERVIKMWDLLPEDVIMLDKCVRQDVGLGGLLV